MSNTRNTPTTATGGALRPLNARSVALSALLGAHPPRASARGLVALAELFGIAPGTMRTALSRAVSVGELVTEDGRYELGAPLLSRQRSQDRARTNPDGDWNGDWHTVIAADDGRDLATRRAFRSTLANFRFGELRPTVWLRPANEPPPAAADDLVIMTGTLDGRDPVALTAELWDLDRLRSDAEALTTRVIDLVGSLDWNDPASIPDGFTASAAVIRYLRAEPRLPTALTPERWPVARLRAEFDTLEHHHQRLLGQFLRSR